MDNLRYPWYAGRMMRLTAMVVLMLGLAVAAWGQSSATGGGTGSSGPASAVSTLLPQSGLLAEYRFLDGSGTSIADSSGNGNTGTLCAGGQAPTWNSPNVGGGLVFNQANTTCANFPAALNSAQTVMLFMYSTAFQQNSGRTFAAPMLGNGAAANSRGLLLTYNDTTLISNPVKGAFHVNTYGTGVTRARSYAAFNGYGDIAIAYDTNDRIYINGKEENVYGVPGTSGSQSVGAWALGGNVANTGTGTLSWWTGTVYYAAFWNRVLAPAEVYQAHQVMLQSVINRGLVMQPPIFTSLDPADEIVGDGDSIEAGANGTNPFASLQLASAGNLDNQSISGRQLSLTPTSTFSGALRDYDELIAPVYHPYAARNLDIIWLGTNDFALGSLPLATVFANLRSYSNFVRGLGFKTAVVTMISRTGQDTNKNNYNTLIRKLWPTFADALIDMAANPNLGADGASANTTFFNVDAVHPTTNSDDNIVTPLFQAGINRFYGAQDFSSANVYAAAAAAAVATTAGSEATNTVTITFGATPANCLAGNMITIAGTTPAGYSGTWYILTRTATQVTYFNPTTGLGAITVQGTGVCQQQQDSDKYSVLNFGAGNFTLESCVGFTGQNIYIKNINAAGSTIVPFGSETIDGAANLSIASKATVILQSILTSAAAGGCNWKQLQNN